VIGLHDLRRWERLSLRASVTERLVRDLLSILFCAWAELPHEFPLSQAVREMHTSTNH